MKSSEVSKSIWATISPDHLREMLSYQHTAEYLRDEMLPCAVADEAYEHAAVIRDVLSLVNPDSDSETDLYRTPAKTSYIKV